MKKKIEKWPLPHLLKKIISVDVEKMAKKMKIIGESPGEIEGTSKMSEKKKRRERNGYVMFT